MVASVCGSREDKPRLMSSPSSRCVSLISETLSRKANKKGATKAKGVVRFAHHPKFINRHAVVTMEDMPNAWYQPQDYKRIKYGLVSSIEAINKVFNNPMQTPNDDDQQPMLDLSEHCLRGIETGISPELHQRRKLRIKAVTQTVLEQQRIQRANGIQDPHALAAISVLCSMGAEESARAVGQLDSNLDN